MYQKLVSKWRHSNFNKIVLSFWSCFYPYLLVVFLFSPVGDVYMIGTANSGKSTLYNSLLNSDYCNHHVRDVITQATVSELPGNYE